MSSTDLMAALIAALAGVPGIGPYLAYLPSAIGIAMAVVSCASAICALVPHPARMDTALGRARTLLNWLALNVAHATPAAVAAASLRDAEEGAAKAAPAAVAAAPLRDAEAGAATAAPQPAQGGQKP